MKLTQLSILLACLTPIPVFAQVPQTVEQTWADYDPRAEPLEVQVIRESVVDDIVLRQIRYVELSRLRWRCAEGEGRALSKTCGRLLSLL